MGEHFTGDESYLRLPQLAGICSMDRATHSRWSLDESVERLKRLHYVLRRSHEALLERIPSESIYELKTAYSYHAYLIAEQVTLIRKRVGEMREPPLGLEHVPDETLEQLLAEVDSSPTTEEFVVGLYAVVIPRLIESCQRLQRDAHPLADAPTARVAKLIGFELREINDFGERAVDSFRSAGNPETLDAWKTHLENFVSAAGSLDGSSERKPAAPQRKYLEGDRPFDPTPHRDERFQDPFNAGVNAEAFLYDERFTARDKTLMMYYKRIRELDVPEMMATILVELRSEEPWEFHFEMARQLWDEARHAMMGEVGFVSLGIDWRKIPINFTWSRNLNLQLSARERHGVLFFIEQGLMPKTGKRFEWEIASESGDMLSKLFQDFDWADEVLHAQIGRRWYVPKFGSLQESLDYGDRCWSKVMSHWADYRDQGLTQHRNWWPEVYRDACRRWGTEPDAEALAFATTYEDSRADLKSIED